MGVRRVCSKPGQVVEYSKVDKRLDGEGQGGTRYTPIPQHRRIVPRSAGVVGDNVPPPAYTGPIRPMRGRLDRPFRHK